MLVGFSPPSRWLFTFYLGETSKYLSIQPAVPYLGQALERQTPSPNRQGKKSSKRAPGKGCAEIPSLKAKGGRTKSQGSSAAHFPLVGGFVLFGLGPSEWQTAVFSFFGKPRSEVVSLLLFCSGPLEASDSHPLPDAGSLTLQRRCSSCTRRSIKRKGTQSLKAAMN